MSGVADVLNGAADLIERDGWCQGSYSGPNGEHCLSDALMRAAGTRPGDTGSLTALTLFKDACKTMDPEVGGWGLPSWNDDPQRTKAEVVAALRAAAGQALK